MHSLFDSSGLISMRFSKMMPMGGMPGGGGGETRMLPFKSCSFGFIRLAQEGSKEFLSSIRMPNGTRQTFCVDKSLYKSKRKRKRKIQQTKQNRFVFSSCLAQLRFNCAGAKSSTHQYSGGIYLSQSVERFVPCLILLVQS